MQFKMPNQHACAAKATRGRRFFQIELEQISDGLEFSTTNAILPSIFERRARHAKSSQHPSKLLRHRQIFLRIYPTKKLRINFLELTNSPVDVVITPAK